MRHTCTLERDSVFTLPHTHLRAWTLASLLALLTSAPASASNEPERDSLIVRERVNAPGPLMFEPATPEDDPSSRTAAEPESHNLYSEAYWNAVSHLDLDATRNAARNAAELEFAFGLSLLAKGEHERAEMTFTTLSTDVTDLNVAVASQLMLAQTLMRERKWSRLRELPMSAALGAADERNAVEIERWGHAFANIEPQVIAFPARPISVPLWTTSVGTPAVRVKINGRVYTFWLDTGASISVLSSEVAEQTLTPIVSADTLMVRTFAGTAKVRPALVRKMEIGAIVLTNTPVIVMHESMMRVKGSGDGAPWSSYGLDGIIGWDIIRQLDVLLDFQRSVATLASPTKLVLVGSSPRNLIWLGRPFVEVRTKKGQTLHLALDTGAQTTLLTVTSIERLGLISRPARAKVFGIARSGSAINRVVPSLSLKLAGRSIDLDDVIVYSPSYSGLIACDGILGSDIFQFGPVHIDATNGILSVG